MKENLSAECMSILELYCLDGFELENMKVLNFKKGDYICRSGYPMDYLFIVLCGTAKVCYTVASGKTLLLSVYSKGGMLGDVELMNRDANATASVQVIDDLRCLAIDINKNRTVLTNNPAFLRKIGENLANKLNRCCINSAITILHPLEARLCSYILITNHDDLFDENLTELCELLGTSYRHLLRTLTRLCKDGILKKEHSRGYRILNKEILHQKSEEFYTI